MINLLDPDADLDYIRESATRGTRNAIIREYLWSRNSILRGFLSELTIDYQTLYALAATEAVHDPVLAAKLVGFEQDFNKAVSSISRRLWLENMLPQSAVRVLISGKLSRVVADQLVARLDNMRVLFGA